MVGFKIGDRVRVKPPLLDAPCDNEGIVEKIESANWDPDTIRVWYRCDHESVATGWMDADRLELVEGTGPW